MSELPPHISGQLFNWLLHQLEAWEELTDEETKPAVALAGIYWLVVDIVGQNERSDQDLGFYSSLGAINRSDDPGKRSYAALVGHDVG